MTMVDHDVMNIHPAMKGQRMGDHIMQCTEDRDDELFLNRFR